MIRTRRLKIHYWPASRRLNAIVLRQPSRAYVVGVSAVINDLSFTCQRVESSTVKGKISSA